MEQAMISIQQELQIAKQQNEIFSLKLQLEKSQARKSSRLEDSLFSPNLFPHYQKVAETLSKSSVIPTSYKGKPEDIFVAMAMGYQLGFPVEQSLQDIAVINGRPCLWGDGLLSLALNHPECQDIKEEPIFANENKSIIGFCCTISRKGHAPHSQIFTLQDAEKAGLLKKGGVWNSYPSRMLQMRARSLALRDKFADALRGLRIVEIEEEENSSSAVEGKIIDQSNSQVEKLKSLIKINQQDTQTKSLIENKIENKEETLINNKKQIEFLISGFDHERKNKAYSYFNIDSLDDLTLEQSKIFLVQLKKTRGEIND